MSSKFFYLLILLTCTNYCFGQPKPANLVETNPDRAKLIYQDVVNFWKAFDTLLLTDNKNAFTDHYIQVGTEGVKNFMDNDRIISGDSLRNYVMANKLKYESVRQNTLGLPDNYKKIRSVYYAFKYLYPMAKYPPVYFVIGRFNTGGTAKPEYQIIGAEMNEPDNILYIVAHELVHANQQIPYKYKILLEQCIIEGSADFLGELISGKVSSSGAYEYAKGKEEILWQDFLKDLNFAENDSFSNWLYGGDRKDDRPADMGYYIGYMITKAYYDKSTDKSKAIKEILNIKDCKSFLAQSGYGTHFKK